MRRRDYTPERFYTGMLSTENATQIRVAFSVLLGLRNYLGADITEHYQNNDYDSLRNNTKIVKRF